jgi:hypothetical protein
MQFITTVHVQRRQNSYFAVDDIAEFGVEAPAQGDVAQTSD